MYVLNCVQVAAGFDIRGLKAMDMWSLAMIFFDLLNPNVYAYEEELSRTPSTYRKKQLYWRHTARKSYRRGIASTKTKDSASGAPCGGCTTVWRSTILGRDPVQLK